MRSMRPYMIMVVTATLCIAMWTPDIPVSAADLGLAGSTSAERLAGAAQGEDPTLQAQQSATVLTASPLAEGPVCNTTRPPGAGAEAGPPMDLAQSCIDKGQACVLHGTPCCPPYECKGRFPNTTCQ